MRTESLVLRTIGDAYQFVMACKICTVFGCEGLPYPSLWNHTELSIDRPEEGGWCPRVEAVWEWQKRLPQCYPDSVVFCKIQGGHAVLMEMKYFRNNHYCKAYEPIDQLSPIARGIYHLVSEHLSTTEVLRNRAVMELGCTIPQFKNALTELQVSLNIARSNDPNLKFDCWVPMTANYQNHSNAPK